MKNGDDLLEWLEEWYFQRCDGHWEHHFGFSIGNIDNPGWTAKMALLTDIKDMDWQKIDRSKDDWIHWRICEGHFEAACGPLNLRETIDMYRQLHSVSSQETSGE
jgi:hypothetical protein